MIKVPNKFGIDGYFLNLITSIYKTPRPNIGMKYVNYSIGYVNSYWKQGKDVCSHYPIQYTIQYNCFSQHNKASKEIKGLQTGKEEIKLSLFADDMTFT